MPSTVLVDLTPLDTPSRYRGIGRYVRALALGLSQLAPEQRADLRFLGLTRLHWSGTYEVTEDLGSFAGSNDLPHPCQRDHYAVAYRKRVALWRAVRAINPDLVHLPDPGATPLGRFATRARWMVTCHDLIAFRFPHQYFTYRDGYGWIGKQIDHRRYASADQVVAISEATRGDLVRFLGIPLERISKVYNGNDIDQWTHPSPTDAAAKYGLKEGSFLLYVGDTDWRKNVEGMMAGLADARTRGADVCLVMAGVLSDARAQRVDSLADQFGVRQWVRRLGFVGDSDLAGLYRKALAHLFVSRAEGFGLSVIEAMASGCPVITTNQGSLAEVAGSAAMLVDPENPGDIGRAIACLATDPHERARLIEQGREQARKFSLQAQAVGMVDVYRRVIAAR